MVGVDVDLFEVGHVSPEQVDDCEAHGEVVGERHPEASFGSRGSEVPFVRRLAKHRVRGVPLEKRRGSALDRRQERYILGPRGGDPIRVHRTSSVRLMERAYPGEAIHLRSTSRNVSASSTKG
jgi:hypothetical protein